MAAVLPFTPQGVVKVLRGVGLDNGYTDTYTFVSKTQQQLFFESKLAYTMENCVPLPAQGAIRFHANANMIYDCDYLMFQNSNYNNKWFYAFITSVQWVSTQLCEVYFELDVVQTWYFDYVFPQMFMEREHTNNDAIGANLQPEGLEIGEWVYQKEIRSSVFDSYVYVVWATVNKSGVNQTGGMYGGVYSGLYANVFETASEVNSFITQLTSAGKVDAIVSIGMVPKAFAPVQGSNSVTVQVQDLSPNFATLDGYTPKNNKLYTYPYNFLKVTNHEGNAGVFRWEFFHEQVISGRVPAKFSIAIDEIPNPTASCFPQFYKGYDEDGLGDPDEQINLTSFPLCSWASDTYKAWLAQNTNTLSWQQENILISAYAGALTSGLSGNIMGMAQSAYSGYANMRSLMAAKEDKRLLPPQAHGSNTGYTQLSLRMQGFYFCYMTITAEFARSIDSYFSMFGYATNQVKTPNIVGRQTWNYTKTQAATVLGNAPAWAAHQMEAILNNGIRWWHGDYIGEYFRPNGITSSAISDDAALIDAAGHELKAIDDPNSRMGGMLFVQKRPEI